MLSRSITPAGVVTDCVMFAGLLWLAYSDGESLLTIVALDPVTLETRAGPRPLARGVFLRLGVAHGRLWGVARHIDLLGEPAVLWDLSSGQGSQLLGPCWGNSPACLDTAGRVWWQDDGLIKRAPVLAPHDITISSVLALPTGISHVVADWPIMWDDVRASFGGYLGTRQGPYVVREHHEVANNGVIVNNGARRRLLWPDEEAFAPVACLQDALFVAAWGRPGIRVARVRDDDLTLPGPPPPPPPPDPPPPPPPDPPPPPPPPMPEPLTAPEAFEILTHPGGVGEYLARGKGAASLEELILKSYKQPVLWAVYRVILLEGEAAAKQYIRDRAQKEGKKHWPGDLAPFDPPGGSLGEPDSLRGDFLTTATVSPGSRGEHTMFFAVEQPDTRKRRIADALARGYTVMSLYVENEGDFGNRPFDLLEDLDQLRARLEELHTAGLWPVLWLYPDDAPRAHARSATSILERFGRIIHAVDDLVIAYVPGLEMDEYWGEDKQWGVVRGLASMTRRQILCHFRDRVWNGRSWWNGLPDHVGLAYQVTASVSESEFRQVLADRVRDLSPRMVVLGESNQLKHDEAWSVRRGRIALEVGCDGFLNGGPRA